VRSLCLPRAVCLCRGLEMDDHRSRVTQIARVANPKKIKVFGVPPSEGRRANRAQRVKGYTLL
jgi:hypothetical protein